MKVIEVNIIVRSREQRAGVREKLETGNDFVASTLTQS